MAAPVRSWSRVQVGDLVRLRGKRRPEYAEVRIQQRLPGNVDGLGILGDNGVEYRRFFYDIQVVAPSQQAEACHLEEEDHGDELGDPICARCLVPMILVSDRSREHWRCGNCGAVRLS
jgi:hypothetical protein